jgi:ABC-2 type transport system ATP-binding protein
MTATTNDAGRIVASGLTKTFGAVLAVSDLSFTVEPGSVTGFLGPNGAGKTTTLRMILGLATPTSGVGTVSGLRYADLPDPGGTVGAVLEATSFHPGRTARNHLRVYCAAAGLPDRRADEVLATVGLADSGRMSVRGFSLGMRQRLGLATALLGDPRVLILDEPANGLDPEGIVWLRKLMRHLADNEGRTVLVSSHVLSEVEQTVDRVVIIAKGRLLYDGTLRDLDSTGGGVLVRTPTPDLLAAAVVPLGVTVAPRDEDGLFALSGASVEAVGHAAWEARVELHELREDASSLEQTFLQLTANESPPPARETPG